MAKTKTDPRRAALIKLIHVARRELGIQDEDYRAMLASMPALGGRTSSADLGIKGLQLVRDALIAKGFVIRPKGVKSGKQPQDRRLADDAQSRLIRSLWIQLHEAGAVRNSAESALASYVKKQTRVEDLHWLDTNQASKVIESLKSWLARATNKGACKNG